MEVDTPQAAKAPEPEVTELSAEKRSLVELSSTTDTESCEAYISRTVELLESVEPTATNPNNEFPDEAKTSTSDPIAITRGLNELLPDEEMPEGVPRVVFLDEPDAKTIPTVTISEEQNELVSPDRGVVVASTTSTVVQQEQTEEETAGNTSQDDSGPTGGPWTTGPKLMKIHVSEWRLTPGHWRDLLSPKPFIVPLRSETSLVLMTLAVNLYFLRYAKILAQTLCPLLARS